MSLTADQIDKIEKRGGELSHMCYVFTFKKIVSQDLGESLTLKKAIEVEDMMMELGFDGALIGHPLDVNDLHYIYFQIS